MDAKLKEKLKEFAQAGLLQWKKSHKPAPIGAQPEPIDSDIKSKALTAWLVRFVRNRLTKEGLWTERPIMGLCFVLPASSLQNPGRYRLPSRGWSGEAPSFPRTYTRRTYTL